MVGDSKGVVGFKKCCRGFQIPDNIVTSQSCNVLLRTSYRQMPLHADAVEANFYSLTVISVMLFTVTWILP